MRNYFDVTWYSTPLSIDAFCRAELDRRKYVRSEAGEPYIAEPLRGEDTRSFRVRRSVPPTPRRDDDTIIDIVPAWVAP